MNNQLGSGQYRANAIFRIAMLQKPVNNQEFKDSRTNHGVPDFRTLRNINRRKNQVVESSWKNLKSVSKVDMFSYLDSHAFL